MKNKMVVLFTIVLFFSSCTTHDSTVDKVKLPGYDYRLFRNTPAWDLANAVMDENTENMIAIVKKDKDIVDYPDPIYGGTLLKMAVFAHKLKSVKTLLTLGADPNKQDIRDRQSALMIAAQLGGGGSEHPYADSRYLKILLKYGGDPNAVQNESGMKHPKTYFSPLLFASFSGILDYVKTLVEAGADVNIGNEHGTSVLYGAIVSKNPNIVLYLLEKGADFKRPMYITVTGEKKYILDAMKIWQFKPGTDDYNVQMKILSFLKSSGLH